MTKPFRMRYGADLALNRGINCDRPAQDTDVANKIFVEEQVAAQSRLKGTYLPDSDGLQTPAPDLDQLVPNVDVLTADYYVCELSGRPNAGPFMWVDLNADDRLVANVGDYSVVTFTLNPTSPTGLIPNAIYRFDPMDPAYPGKGRSLGLVLTTDGTGTVSNAVIANNGHSYQPGDVLNASIENSFVNAVETMGAVVPATFQLLPDTTYYDALITGGTGAGAVANFRTDATGTAISDVFLIARGAGYTAGDVLTIEIEGQTIGTITVATVFSGTDVACQVTINTVATDVGWDLIRGAGLTRAQANRDYLRLDGGNEPTRDIYWNNQRIKELADPLDPRDAVNLRTLNSSSVRLYLYYVEPGHTWTDGLAVRLNATLGILQPADSTRETGLADGLIEVIDADSYYVVTKGPARVGVHGFLPGTDLFLDPANPGQLTATRPQIGYVQTVGRARSLTEIDVLSQASTYTGFDPVSFNPLELVEFGYNASTDTYTRTPVAERNIQVHSAMRRCLLTDAGVATYLDADDSTLLAGDWLRLTETTELDTAFTGTHQAEQPNTLLRTDLPAWVAGVYSQGDRVIHNGSVWECLAATTTATPAAGTVAATLDGSAGQVMVEIPIFSVYQGVRDLGTVYDHRFAVLPGAVTTAGFQVHPAFIRPNGTYRNRIYIGAYAGTGVDGNGSVSGVNNVTGYTRAAARAACASRGAGWSQLSYWYYNAVQWLLITEYQDVNSQRCNGNGADANQNISIAITGPSNSRGNRCVSVDNSHSSYRGLENIYGRSYEYVDGINLFDKLIYTCNNPAIWADDTTTGYVLSGELPAVGTTYILRDMSATVGLFPHNQGGIAGGTAYMGDSMYSSGGTRVVSMGGRDNSYALGIFCWNSQSDSSGAATHNGARLAFAL